MLVLVVVVRNWPAKISSSLYDRFIGMTGTLMPLFLRPAEMPQESGLLVGMQVVGVVISMAGVVSLYKSFGIVAANRGIRTSGLYRFIRHPLYAGYFFCAMHPTPYNTAVYGVFVIFEVLCMFAEERLLLLDREYQAYAARVKWRVLPGVW